MTIKQVEAIKVLNKAGLNDMRIAERLGVPVGTVNHWRNDKLGLPRVGINRTSVKYSVYDARTTQFICEGTTRECAKFLGLTPSTFRTYCTHSRKGTKRIKYEIHGVTNDEED